MDCIFCSIVATPHRSFAYEDDTVVAFPDIHPKAPVHILIVPRKHVPSVSSLTEADEALAGRLLLAARFIAERQGIVASGYRLILNVGRGAGQSVDHLHIHLLGGGPLQAVTA